MSRKGVNITEAEWPIMAFVWERDSATAAEIVDCVIRDRDISMRTVKSLLRRLVAKGAVTYTVDPDDARVYHYSAAVTRDDAVHARKRVFLRTVFNDNPLDLLAHFVKDSALSAQDIDELRGIIEKKRRESDDNGD